MRVEEYRGKMRKGKVVHISPIETLGETSYFYARNGVKLPERRHYDTGTV